MGLSQSTKNKFKIKFTLFKNKTKKCFKQIKNNVSKKFNLCYVSCCIPKINIRKNSEEIVNSNIELKEIKSEEPDVKLINCKLNKKTPSLNNYVNDRYIRVNQILHNYRIKTK